jgi:L-fuconolactonase
MRIDAHQHFWKYSEQEYPWMKPDWIIRRDFLPRDLEPLLRAHDLDGCVAVQARQTFRETEWLLELAEQHSIIRGVVGWVDLRSPEVEAQLSACAKKPKLVAVRHVVQDEPDERFMLREDFLRGVALLHKYNLAYDLLVFPNQLAAAIEVSRLFPNQRFVLDHIAKPYIRKREISPWAENLAKLAGLPNVFCKLSGIITEADWATWNSAGLKQYLQVAWDAFGSERMMYGSDWPVCLLAGSYHKMYALVADFAENLSEREQRRLFGETACEFYRLKA